MASKFILQCTPAADTDPTKIGPKLNRTRPIILTRPFDDPKILFRCLTHLLLRCTFTFRTTSANQQQIITYSDGDHDTIRQKLDDEKVEFYAYGKPAQGQKRLVLNGIDFQHTVEEIAQDLRSQINDIDDAIQMTSKREKERTKLNIYIILEYHLVLL